VAAAAEENKSSTLDRYMLVDRDGAMVSLAPANLSQQQKVFEMQRALRLMSQPRLHDLTGNSFGCFNNYTLLDTVRRRYLANTGGEFFGKQGKVMQISFFVHDDGDMFKEALFFNFAPAGVQLSDFGPEGRGPFKKVPEVEQAVKFLQLFWNLVYGGGDELGALPVGVALDPLLLLLDTSTLLSALSPVYVAAVVDMALMSVAAELDSPLPKGESRSTRQWWELVGVRFRSLVFSKDNQDLFTIAESRKAEVASRKASKDSAGIGKGAVVVTPPKAPASGGGPHREEASPQVCYTAIRNHYQLPAGASPCSVPACPRVHPEGYKNMVWSDVKSHLAAARQDFSDVVRAVHADQASFRA
jgi:hypothetical protein